MREVLVEEGRGELRTPVVGAALFRWFGVAVRAVDYLANGHVDAEEVHPRGGEHLRTDTACW